MGNFRRSQPFSISLWAETPDRKERAVVLHRSRAWTDAASRGYELLLEEGRWKWSLIHFWPGNAISIRTRMEAPLNQWTHVTATYDGSSRAAGLKLYIDGKPVDCEVVRDNLTKEITGGGGDNIAIGERIRDRGCRGGKVDELRVFDRQLTAWEVAQLPSNCDAQLHAVALESLGPVDAQLQETAIHTGDETFRTALVALQQKREALHQLEDSIQEIMVMRELPGMKTAYLLTRGEYNQRGEAVEPGVPEALPPLPEGTPANRLSVARWLTAPNHPLTAR
ncbi:MAG: LamG-like jellyroll fold domain-containing protein, partial [Pirellulaceae bacterium]